MILYFNTEAAMEFFRKLQYIYKNVIMKLKQYRNNMTDLLNSQK